jgi:large subunit ribosomal protein L32
MAVPKKKTSKSKRDMRRSHDRLKDINFLECDNCGSTKLPHRVCLGCGFYNGKKIISTQKDNADTE